MKSEPNRHPVVYNLASLRTTLPSFILVLPSFPLNGPLSLFPSTRISVAVCSPPRPRPFRVSCVSNRPAFDWRYLACLRGGSRICLFASSFASLLPSSHSPPLPSYYQHYHLHHHHQYAPVLFFANNLIEGLVSSFRPHPTFIIPVGSLPAAPYTD